MPDRLARELSCLLHIFNGGTWIQGEIRMKVFFIFSFFRVVILFYDWDHSKAVNICPWKREDKERFFLPFFHRSVILFSCCHAKEKCRMRLQILPNFLNNIHIFTKGTSELFFHWFYRKYAVRCMLSIKIKEKMFISFLNTEYYIVGSSGNI